MPEYIDKQAFIEDIETEIINLKLDGMKGTPMPCDELYGFIERIKEQPPADVAPVIHAKWKFVAGPDEDNNLQFMCDNCGAGDVHAADVTVPYCWKCGARMDGGDEE